MRRVVDPRVAWVAGRAEEALAANELPEMLDAMVANSVIWQEQYTWPRSPSELAALLREAGFRIATVKAAKGWGPPRPLSPRNNGMITRSNRLRFRGPNGAGKRR
jgi:hypothetical protein